jgi:rhamnosyl/mannosyltransferase
MKILQLGKAYPPINLGGVETTIQLITEGLHANKVYCDVLGVNDKIVSDVNEHKYGKIYREALLVKAFSTLFSLSLIYRLWKIHKNYDIIHVHHPDPMSALALWFVNPNSKIVLHWHSDILRQKRLLKFYLPIQNWLLNKSDLIIATTLNYANGSKHLKPFLNKTQIIPIGIDEKKLKIDNYKVEQILNRYKGQKLILAIGRMSYYKGYEYLFNSLKYLNNNYRLLIVGVNHCDFKFNEMIPEKYLNKIDFLGRISDLDRNCFLAACDLFVLSSVYKTEAFAIVQVEAMAFSKPVVSTEIPESGVQWVNMSNESGLTVPIKDSLAIANAISSILENPKLYEKLSKGAFNRFKSEFTQDIMVNRLIDLYNHLTI